MPLTRLPLTTGVSGTLAAGNGGTGVTSADEIGNLVLLNSGTISSVSSIEFDNSYITDTYKFYELNLSFYCNTDFQYYLQTSTDNGSNYASSSTSYAWVFGHTGTQGGFASIYDQDDTAIILGDSLANTDNLPVSGRIRIMNPTDSSTPTTVQGLSVGFHSTNGDVKQLLSFGRRQAKEDNNAIRITSSQTMQSGHYALYGVRA